VIGGNGIRHDIVFQFKKENDTFQEMQYVSKGNLAIQKFDVYYHSDKITYILYEQSSSSTRRIVVKRRQWMKQQQ
jgi:CMP-N-acetylneuraminic acid synthetase